MALFANLQALDRYQAHPRHLPVIKKIQQIGDKVVTVDFEGSDAGSLNINRPEWDFKPLTKIWAIE